MLRPAVDLDVEMTASAVLERLANNGFWLSPRDPAARQRIESLSRRVKREFDDVARSLTHDPRSYGVAIRRQWGANILWYARDLLDVLNQCTNAAPEALLIDVLNLHESDSTPPMQLDNTGRPLYDGVVMQRGEPVAVVLDVGPPPTAAVAAAAAADEASSTLRGAGPPVAPGEPHEPRAPAPAATQVWPRIDAPEFKPAAQAFDVVVGFAASQQTGVAGGPVKLPFMPETPVLDLTIELSAGEGIEAPQGWSRPLRVSADTVMNAEVRFNLVGTEPSNRERAWLTTLEVRYVLAGTICGTASRKLVILPAASTGPPPALPFGTAWQSMPATASPVTLIADVNAPDLTIEITKPDDDTKGHYTCRLISPHALTTAAGPFKIVLGDDAKTFAKQMVDDLRTSTEALIDLALESIGKLVTECLPQQLFDALNEVATRVAPAVPAVLIVSAEPYAPWELAWMFAPLDATRPSFLGSQAIVGRWLRDSSPDPGTARIASTVVTRPATHPVAAIDVDNMAVMAALYKSASGMRRLPKAEDEAKQLAKSYPGVLLPAIPQELRNVLNATVRRGIDAIEIQAMHFAGHGDFDPSRPDGAAMFLESGDPLRSMLFRAAKYGGARQPLLFLNACMLGIGGELLGDMGGFPGNSLRGGFGGVLGALWEVDDDVAHDIALEFWSRALPPAPASGEPIGAILRDLRAKYVPGATPAPIATYLAYVYYGHPRLTLRRAQ
jgi:uncharacterized protein associated with vWA-MoxR-VMAP ternary system/CHAT domain-containing protein